MDAFDQIIGREDTIKKLKKLIPSLKNEEKDDVLSKICVLHLFGKCGCGKTKIAECFANETGREVVFRKQADFKFNWVEEIKQTLLSISRSKNDGPYVVVLDDFLETCNDVLIDLNHNDSNLLEIKRFLNLYKYERRVFFVLTTKYDYKNIERIIGKEKVISLDCSYTKKEKRLIIKDMLHKEKRLIIDDYNKMTDMFAGSSLHVVDDIILESVRLAVFNGKEIANQTDLENAFCDYNGKIGIFHHTFKPWCDCTDEITYTYAKMAARSILLPETLSAIIDRTIDNYKGQDVSFVLGAIIESSEYRLDDVKFLRKTILIRLAGLARLDILPWHFRTLGEQVVEDYNEALRCTEELLRKNRDYLFEFENAQSQKAILKKEKLITKAIEFYYKIAKKFVTENKSFITNLMIAGIKHTHGYVIDKKEIELVKAKSCVKDFDYEKYFPTSKKK